MGTITISIRDSDEARLRELAMKKFGKTKGSMSKVITEAISKIDDETDQDKDVLDIARKGLHLGKVDIKKIREDMYGRY